MRSARLCAYAWPGNIRELQSVLRQALLHASGTTLLSAFLPNFDHVGAVAPSAGAPSRLDVDAFVRERLVPGANDVYAETHREVDRLLFVRTLEHTGGNHRDAARILGISRQTMRVKLRALGIHVAHTVEADDDSAA